MAARKRKAPARKRKAPSKKGKPTRKRKAPARKRKALSAATRATLRRKAARKKNITYGTLAKVYRRGQGAFLTAGSRPGVGMSQWAMGRVNSYLRGSRKHDTDLRRKKKK